MKRCLGGLAALAIGAVALAGPANAANAQRVCPIPVVGGDPDTVTLAPSSTPAGPGRVAYTVTADESPGEASHVVALIVRVSSRDHGRSSTVEPLGKKVGFSPTVVHLVLQTRHHYRVAWVASFDFGIHPCASAAPGESAFQIAT